MLKMPGKTEREVYNILLKDVTENCLKKPAYMNYTQAFTKAPLLRYLLNGVIVTASIFLLQVVVAFTLKIHFTLFVPSAHFSFITLVSF